MRALPKDVCAVAGFEAPGATCVGSAGACRTVVRPTTGCAGLQRLCRPPLELGIARANCFIKCPSRSFTADTVRWKSSFVQPDGSLAAEDDLFLNRGAFEGYRYVRWISVERPQVWVRGGTVVFRRRMPGGGSRVREEPLVDGFVTGPYLALYPVKPGLEIKSGSNPAPSSVITSTIRLPAFQALADLDLLLNVLPIAMDEHIYCLG